MNKEKQQGLIAGAIAFVLVVMLFLFIGSDPNTSTEAAPAPTNNNNSGLLMAVTFTLTLLGLIAFNHFRGKMPPTSENDNDLIIKEDDNSLHYQLAQTRRDLQNSQREYQNAIGTIKQLQEAILNLFGTTDFTVITSTISALYSELEELRGQKEQRGTKANLEKQLTRQQELTARLANERNQATARINAIRQTLAVDETASLIQVVGEVASQAHSSQSWQEKAEQDQQELVRLRHDHKEATQWKAIELATFMETVNYGQEKLTTNRWARRLEQRFNKEQLKLVGHPNLTKLPLTEPEAK